MEADTSPSPIRKKYIDLESNPSPVRVKRDKPGDDSPAKPPPKETSILESGMEILDGKFKVVRKMGSGAFGEVYRVEKKGTGQILAAKVVSLYTN